MAVQADVLRVLDDPELDSMAVVTLITTLEEQFGIVVDDDDIDGDTFANVGALVAFVSTKQAG